VVDHSNEKVVLSCQYLNINLITDIAKNKAKQIAFFKCFVSLSPPQSIGGQALPPEP
jgi:hypothetical protein